MKGETIIFYLLAAMTLVSALLAVSSRQLFRLCCLSFIQPGGHRRNLFLAAL